MNSQSILFLVIVFFAAFAVIWLVMNFLSIDPTRRRISDLSAGEAPNESIDSEMMSKLVRVVDPISKLSLASDGWEKSPLQRKFINAGWRNPDAPKIYFAI